MHGALPSPATERPSLAQAAESVGFRRVELVRVTLGPARATAEATGVLHRYPRTMAISMSAARRLVAAGAPLHIEHVGQGDVR